MSRFHKMLVGTLIVPLALASMGNVPVSPRHVVAAVDVPVGKWRIVFDNGVIEECTIRRDGWARVVEPLRSSDGKVVIENKAFVIACDDDRTERWVPRGTRMRVEHYCPGSQRATVTPVLGIAERLP